MWIKDQAMGLVTFIAVLACMGCTRQAQQMTLHLTFNQSRSSGNGSQSVSGDLTMAIINIQLPSGPYVQQVDLHGNPLPLGQDLNISVPNVPNGTFLVQFLGVYQTLGSPMVLRYGDNYATVDGAPSEVDISANLIGNGAPVTQGRVAGRYITQSSPEDGPTGTLIMKYTPASNPAFPMSLDRTPIVNGWFNIMALDGASVDYVLEGQSQPLLAGVSLSGAVLNMNGAVQAPSTSVIKLAMPATFRNDGDGKTDARPPSTVYIGYFYKPGVTPTTKKVCYASDVHEAAFGQYNDPSFTNPVDFHLTSGSATEITVAAGGVSDVMSALYTGTSSVCSVASESFTIYHTTLTGDENSTGGITPPFAPVAPFVPYDQYVSANLHFVGASPAITLHWAYLPGASAFDGVEILAKASSDGGGGSGDQTCADLISKENFMDVGSVMGSSQMTYDFTGAGGQAVSFSNGWQWQFAICPFKNTAQGKMWIGNYVNGGHIGHDGEFSAGWASMADTFVGSTNESYASYGYSGRVTAVDASSSFYTALNTSSTITNINPGDQVMLSVTAMGGSTTCGVYNGQAINPGQVDFARVLAVPTSMSLEIAKGGLADAIDQTMLSATAAAGSSFCVLQVTKVLQYRSMNLSATTSFAQAAPADLSITSGGFLPIRVNGTLTLGATVIKASNVGYMGGGIGQNGGGPMGAPGSGLTGGGSLDASDAACGASGWFGNLGGAGTSCTPTPLSMGGGGFQSLFLGPGGGGGTSGGGSPGGGAIFIVARQIIANAGASFLADGGAGLSNGGGGAGGSITLLSQSIIGSGSLTLSAMGGDGATATAGGGAGGMVNARVCSSSVSLTGVVNGGQYGSTPAQPGLSSINSNSDGSVQNFCQILE